MKKFFLKLSILFSLFLVGCTTNNISEPIHSNQGISTTLINKHDVFNGIWVRTDGESNVYFKIREDFIEYQSNKTFFNYYDVITNIIYDDSGKNLYLITRDNCDFDKKSKGDTTHIEIIDSNTIKFNGKVATRVLNMKRAVNELLPIFEANYQYNPEYSLERFLEITSDDLKIMLHNKA